MTLYWKRVARFSPILCRLLARHRYGGPMTSEELAVKMVLFTPWQVDQLSEATSWDGITVAVMRGFTTACNLDISNAAHMRRAEDYLRKTMPNSAHLALFGVPRTTSPAAQPFSYLRKDKLWKPYFQPLLRRWIAHVQTLR